MSRSSQNPDHFTLAEAAQFLAQPLTARPSGPLATAPVEPPVNLPGGNPQQPKPGVCRVRAAECVPQHRLHHLEVTRRRLPLTDPDRHDLDAGDNAFAALAPGYAEAVAWSNRYVAEHSTAAVTL